MSSVVKSSSVNIGSPFVINPLPKSLEEDPANETKVKKEIAELLEQAQNDAQQILNEANAEADKILSQARRQSEEMRESAKEEGYNTGYNQGNSDGYDSGHKQAMQEIKDRTDELLDESRQLRQMAQNEFDEVLHKAEPEIINIILAVCSNIIGDEIESRPDKISSMVRKVLSESGSPESVIIKVSPEDYDALAENLDTILKYSAYSGSVNLKRDVSVASGNFTIETPMGNIDAGIKIQLELLERTFYNLLG